MCTTYTEIRALNQRGECRQTQYGLLPSKNETLSNVGVILDQCRRQWTSVTMALVQRLVLAGCHLLFAMSVYCTYYMK